MKPQDAPSPLPDVDQLPQLSAETSFLYKPIAPIYEVWLGPNGFIVGGWVKKIEIPYANVTEVIEARWRSPEQITLVLNTPCEFGPRIRFMPARRLFPWFSSHPTYLQLVELIRQRNLPAE